MSLKLPLFVSASPQLGQSSSSVLIGKGKWRVSSNHKESTTVELTSLCSHLIPFSINHGDEITVERKTMEVIATVKHMVGYESSLSIFMELMGD